VVALDDTTFVMADIPGLIEGAHQGAGLGLEFLRHLQRTRLLVHLLDGASPDPMHDFRVVNEELARYSSELRDKPQVVAFNKIDLPESRRGWEELTPRLGDLGVEALALSAATGEGTRELLELVVSRLGELEQTRVPAEEAEERVRVYRLEARPEETLEVRKEADGYRIQGKAAERAAALTNVDTPEGMMVLRRRLARLGIGKLLRRAGAKEGDLIRVGEAAFPWEDGSR
jgi:GTP-binding protein